MLTFLKRMAFGKKGLEALQAVLILLIAFLIVLSLRDIGRRSTREAGQRTQSIVAPTGESGTPATGEDAPR